MSILDWVAVIGVFAWFPCAYPILRGKFTKSAVDILTSKIIRVGFDMHGPIIDLTLAFSVKHHDLIINNFEIMLKHEDGEKRMFAWQGINQNPHVSYGGFMVIARRNSILAIKLSQQNLVKRSILCCDPSVISEKDKLTVELNKKIRLMADQSTSNSSNIFDSKEVLDLKDCLAQSFNWRTGRYTMIIELGSLENFKISNSCFHFSLSIADVEELTRNKDEIMKSIVLDLTHDSENNPRPKWHSTVVSLIAGRV